MWILVTRYKPYFSLKKTPEGSTSQGKSPKNLWEAEVMSIVAAGNICSERKYKSMFYESK